MLGHESFFIGVNTHQFKNKPNSTVKPADIVLLTKPTGRKMKMKTLLAILTLTFLTITSTSCKVEDATAQVNSAMQRSTNMAYKSHHRWGYTYLDWCKQEKFQLNEQEGRTLMHINSMLSYLGAKRTKEERKARMTQCEKYDQFVKYELKSLALNGLQLEELSPLFSLIGATKLEAVYLDGQGLEQKDIDLMGFFDEIPSMRVIRLPRNETGKVGDCPLARVKC